MGVLESISRFTDTVGDTINITFKTIGDFIDTIMTFFISMGFWTSVLIFFVLFFAIFSLPLMAFKYWDDAVSRYRKITNSIIGRISK